MPGFRSFANEINKQGPSANLNPTFDNFKKKLDQSPTRHMSQSPTKRAAGGGTKDQLFSSFGDMDGKKDSQPTGAKLGDSEPYTEHLYNLQQKIRNQRDAIKTHDDRMDRYRAR